MGGGGSRDGPAGVPMGEVQEGGRRALQAGGVGGTEEEASVGGVRALRVAVGLSLGHPPRVG